MKYDMDIEWLSLSQQALPGVWSSQENCTLGLVVRFYKTEKFKTEYALTSIHNKKARAKIFAAFMKIRTRDFDVCELVKNDKISPVVFCLLVLKSCYPGFCICYDFEVVSSHHHSEMLKKLKKFISTFATCDKKSLSTLKLRFLCWRKKEFGW